MRNLMIAVSILGLSAPGIALAQDRPERVIQTVETYEGTAMADFLDRASEANQFGIESSRAVMEKVSPSVREFAEKLIADHTALGSRLLTIAENVGVRSPSEDDMGAQQELLVSSLEGQHPAVVNTTYLDAQVRWLKRDVALYQSYAESRHDNPLTAYAQESLPILEENLQIAEDLQGSLNASADQEILESEVGSNN